jgi:hypothetical protein
MRKNIIGLLILSVVALAACPGGGVPGVPGSGGGAASSVDPNTCGNYAANDAGKKLKAFLEATVKLKEAVTTAEAEMKVSCEAMAKELGVSTEGSTGEVCKAVSDAIKENLSVGLQAGAKLTLDYQPAVCTVSADVAASAAASCEGSASADVSVSCTGTCNGTCKGECAGTCEGSNEGGECNGACDGTCSGTCEGECAGVADVDASAECEASAEISANVEAECTEPELTVNFEAGMVVDQPKVDKVVAALKAGMPKMFKLTAMAKGPLLGAFTGWAKTAKDLAGSSAKLYQSLGDQASCVAKQLGAAANLIAQIKASLDVQVEVSVSVSASASAEGSAAAGG